MSPTSKSLSVLLLAEKVFVPFQLHTSFFRTEIDLCSWAKCRSDVLTIWVWGHLEDYFVFLISWFPESSHQLSPPTFHHTINKRGHRHPLGCIRFLHFGFNLLISKGHNKPETLNSWQREKNRKGKPFSGWLWSYYVWGSIFVICWGIRNMTKSYHRAGHTRALNYSQLGALVCFCKVVKASFFPPL